MESEFGIKSRGVFGCQELDLLCFKSSIRYMRTWFMVLFRNRLERIFRIITSGRYINDNFGICRGLWTSRGTQKAISFFKMWV